MTFGYKVMIESNSDKRPSWIWQIWWPKWAPASAPSKNEFSGLHLCQISCLWTNLQNTPLENPLGPGLESNLKNYKNISVQTVLRCLL